MKIERASRDYCYSCVSVVVEHVHYFRVRNSVPARKFALSQFKLLGFSVSAAGCVSVWALVAISESCFPAGWLIHGFMKTFHSRLIVCTSFDLKRKIAGSATEVWSKA